jgi:hypothetical protein
MIFNTVGAISHAQIPDQADESAPETLYLRTAGLTNQTTMEEQSQAGSFTLYKITGKYLHFCRCDLQPSTYVLNFVQ